MRRFTLLILAFIFIAVLIAYYPQVTDDADIWWHLRCGQSILQSGSWRPDHAVYSWTPADGTWIYVSWLGSLVLYGLYRIGGFLALSLMQWAIFFSIAGIYAWFLRLMRLSWTTLHIVILFFAGIAVNPIAVYLKPELFSLFFFALTVALFFAAKLTRRSFYWIYGFLFLLWVNLHGGFVYGIAFLALAWGCETFSYLSGFQGAFTKSAWLKFSAALVLAIAATFINPYGWRYGPGILESIRAGAGHVQVISAYSSFFAYLIPPPFMFRNMNAGWCLLGMAFCLVWLVGRGYQKQRRVDLTVIAVNAIFFVAGLFIMRVSAFFCVLWLFSIVYLMKTAEIKISRIAERFALFLAGAAAILLMWETAAFNTYRSYFGRGLQDYVPADAAAFIKRNRVPPPLFNDYVTGGYLLWELYPDYKVFIDPRYGPYLKTGVWDAYVRLVKANSLPALTDIQRDYPFRSAVVSLAHSPALADLFLSSPEWRLAYFDAAAAVFVKSSYNEPKPFIGDMSPFRFKDLSNPDMLARLFVLYCRYNPPDAEVIHDIYQRNVSRFYARRNSDLNWMSKSLPRPR